jgi:hypothetical protein
MYINKYYSGVSSVGTSALAFRTPVVLEYVAYITYNKLCRFRVLGFQGWCAFQGDPLPATRLGSPSAVRQLNFLYCRL